MKNTKLKRQLSAEGRANIAAAQKARWARTKRGTNHAPVDEAVNEPLANLLRRDDPPSVTNPADLIRSAVESMENERATLTVRIDTLKDVLAQM